MRILWLCNIMLPAIAAYFKQDYSVREGWLTGTFQRFLDLSGKTDGEDLSLGVCFPCRPGDTCIKEKITLQGVTVSCYGYTENQNQPQIYQPELEEQFRGILADFNPDLVHIFGTEFPHCLAMARVFERKDRILIGLQGIISACADEYFADLPQQVVKMKTLRDLLRRDGLMSQQYKFFLRGEMEQEAVGMALNATGRTDFDRAAVQRMNPDIRYFHMNETMRPDFYTDGWNFADCIRHRIFFSQADYPLKGFHYLLQALPEIILNFPDTEVVVAGNSLMHDKGLADHLKISGYGAYLKHFIEEWELQRRITFTGTLTAAEIKEQYLLCHTFVCASSLENSPNSVAEAMLLGTPVIASAVGGIPSMITDNKDGLLFQKGNSRELSKKIIHLWNDTKLQNAISSAAAKKAHLAHDPETNYNRLMEIYKTITDS